MGMFDDVKGNFWCPYCGKKMVHTFQTKDLAKSLQVFQLENALVEYYMNLKEGEWEQFHINAECSNCNKWVNLEITRLVDYNMRDKIKKFIEESKESKEKLCNELYNSLSAEETKG